MRSNASEHFLRFLQQMEPAQRCELEATALEFGQTAIDPLNPDQWETLAWIVADQGRAAAATEGHDMLVFAFGLAAAMFQQARQLREPAQRH